MHTYIHMYTSWFVIPTIVNVINILHLTEQFSFKYLTMSGQSCEELDFSPYRDINFIHYARVYSFMSLPVPSSETTTAGVAVVAVEDVITVAETT